MNEKEFFIYLGYRYKDRIRLHFKKDKGEILDLFFQFEAMINEKWVVVVR